MQDMPKLPVVNILSLAWYTNRDAVQFLFFSPRKKSNSCHLISSLIWSLDETALRVFEWIKCLEAIVQFTRGWNCKRTLRMNTHHFYSWPNDLSWLSLLSCLCVCISVCVFVHSLLLTFSFLIRCIASLNKQAVLYMGATEKWITHM